MSLVWSAIALLDSIYSSHLSSSVGSLDCPPPPPPPLPLGLNGVTEGDPTQLDATPLRLSSYILNLNPAPLMDLSHAAN